MERSSTIPPFSTAPAAPAPLRGRGALRPSILLDRDGVLNRDRGYVAQAEQFEFLPGVFGALRTLQAAGFALVVVTNQSGIGRGYYSAADYERLTGWMRNELFHKGIALAGVYHCPHAPEENCSCRKPAPGMILAAARELKLDLSRSWLVGDKPSDLEAAERAGVPNRIFVRGSHVAGTLRVPGLSASEKSALEEIYVCDSLADVPALIAQHGSRPAPLVTFPFDGSCLEMQP